jgi:O-antigen/teichoic acid export membrane protein
MAVKGRFIKGGLILAGSNIAQQALQFFRNVLLALLLPPEQFGIALTLAIVILSIDALSDMGVEMFIVRSPKANDDHFLSAMHMMQVTRGIVTAVALFLTADFFTWLFQTPDAVWAYRALAIVPLLRGFVHLDYRRFERSQNYAPGSMSHLASVTLSTAVAILTAYLWQNFYAMLAAYVVQAVTFTAFTHFFAKSRYRIKYDKAEVLELLPFSTPLILNAMLLFTIVQGDRIVIGAKLGMAALASYGIIAVFTAGITLMVSKLTIPLYTPILAQAVPGSSDHSRRYMICGCVSAILAMASVIGFGVVGYPAAQLAFGSKYELDALLISFLGMQSGFKVLRNWPQIGLMVSGDTKSLLYANIVSLVGIGAAFILIRLGYGLTPVAFAMAAGEAIAAIFSITRTGTPGSVVRRHGLLLLAGLFAAAGLVFAMHYLRLAPSGFLQSLGVGMLAGLAAAIFINIVSPDFFAAAREMVMKRVKPSSGG